VDTLRINLCFAKNSIEFDGIFSIFLFSKVNMGLDENLAVQIFLSMACICCSKN